MVDLNCQAYGRNFASPPEQLSKFYNHGQGARIPAGWAVSVGLLDSLEAAGQHHFRPFHMIYDSGQTVPAQGTWICVEKAVFHILSSLSQS